MKGGMLARRRHSVRQLDQILGSEPTQERCVMVSEQDTASLPELASAETSRERQGIPRALYGDLVQAIEFALVIAMSLFVSYYYHNEVLIITFDAQLYASAGIIAATCVTTLLRRDGYYDFDRIVSSSRAVPAVISRWCVTVLALIAFGFTLKISDAYSRIWVFTWTAAMCVAFAGTRIAAAAYLRRAARQGGVFSRRIALIGAPASADAFKEAAQRSGLGVEVAGLFPLSPSDDGETMARDEVQRLERLTRAGKFDDILIAPNNMSRGDMEELIGRLSDFPVTVSILSSLYWLDHSGGEIVRIGSAPALALYRRPLEGWGGVLKTLEDRLLGLVLFIVALPILAACALALRFQGAGPILFSQQRMGLDGREFFIYKFRTMTVAEDGATVTQATQGDARITPVGRFLRKWSLDELPQLINVMKGEMSLVGPRPHALAHNDSYAQKIENYSGRHKVKPGITGWAQVNGLRGETSENEQMEARVRFDLEYIDNWSLWFDVKILVMTVWAVLFPKNAY